MMAAEGKGLGSNTGDERPNDVKEFCQPCTKEEIITAAHVFCSTCNEYQCLECSNRHKIYSIMKNHRLVDVDAPPEERFVYDMGGLDRCEKHNKTVKFFCKSDGKLCCSTCAIIEHKNCSLMEEIQNIEIKEINGDADIRIRLGNWLEKCSEAVKHWTDEEEHLKTKLQVLKDRLTGIKASVTKKLDAFEEDMMQQATSVSELKKAEFHHNRSNTEESVSLLERRLDMINAAKRYGTPEQQFIIRQRANESLARLHGKASEELSKLENVDISLELSRSLELLLGSIEKLGSLKLSTTKVKVDSIVETSPFELKKIMPMDPKQSSDDTKEPS